VANVSSHTFAKKAQAPARTPSPAKDPKTSPLREPGAVQRVLKSEAEDRVMTPSSKEEARSEREAARMKALLAARTKCPDLMGKRSQSPAPSSSLVAAAKAAQAAAKKDISSDDERPIELQGAPLMAEELVQPKAGYSSDSDHLRPSERRGRSLNRSSGPILLARQTHSGQDVRLISEQDASESSDSDDRLESAAQRRESKSARLSSTRSIVNARAEAARRANPGRQLVKANL